MSVAQAPLHIHEKQPDEFDIFAICTPKSDKVERLESLLRELTQKIHDTEPSTLRYQLHKGTSLGPDAPIEYVLLETYASKEAHSAHVGSPPFQALFKAFNEEELLAKEPTILRVKSIAGFERRAQ